MAVKLPDRWLNYKSCGKVITGTRIICFKVPLDKKFQVKSAQRWTIKNLLETIPNLSAVIDLTNTSRYYESTALLSAGVQYKKILTPGRLIPPESKVTEFMDAVDMYLEKDDGSLVGVHCTHGLNRTGYMVGRYMRDRLGVLPKDAIKMFEVARGYKMERQNYISDLLRKPPPSPDIGKETKIISVKEKRKNNINTISRQRKHKEDTEEIDAKTTTTKTNRACKRRRSSLKSFDYEYDY